MVSVVIPGAGRSAGSSCRAVSSQFAKRRQFILAAFVATLMLALVSSVRADERLLSQSVAKCILLAADPKDSLTLGGGVWSYELNLPAATQACRNAGKDDPSNLVVIYLSGRLATEAHDYRTARSLFEQAATGGYLSAIARLADLYYFGLGVTEDKRQGRELLQQAANRGDPYSQATLAMLILRTDPKEPTKIAQARMLAEAAAKAGSADGYFAVGMMHYMGLAGYAKDIKSATVALLKASDLGLLDARFAAGDILLTSQSHQEVEMGISLIRSAAALGHKRSIYLLRRLKDSHGQ
jgi:hypothetical protein